MVDIANRPVILKIYLIAGSWTEGGKGGGLYSLRLYIEVFYTEIFTAEWKVCSAG